MLVLAATQSQSLFWGIRWDPVIGAGTVVVVLLALVGWFASGWRTKKANIARLALDVARDERMDKWASGVDENLRILSEARVRDDERLKSLESRR